MTRLCSLIAAREGLGALPTYDLENTLFLLSRRVLIRDPITNDRCPIHTITVSDALHIYAPKQDYLEYILNGFGGRIDRDTLLADVLEIPADPR